MSLRELEKELLAPKAWALRGEVEAKHRPTDALLETDDIEFPISRNAVKITKEIVVDGTGDEKVDPREENHQSEEMFLSIIKQRIAQNLFDNVSPNDLLDEQSNKNSGGVQKLEETTDVVSTAAPEKGLTAEYRADAFISSSGTTAVLEAETKCLEKWDALRAKLDAYTRA